MMGPDAGRGLLLQSIAKSGSLVKAGEVIAQIDSQAIKDHDLHPFGYPHVHSPKSDEIAADKPLNFTATVYVRPQVQLGDYRIHIIRILQVIPPTPQRGVHKLRYHLRMLF